MSDLDSVMKNLGVAIYNAKEQCQLALDELNRLKVENDASVRKFEEVIKGIFTGGVK